MQTKNSHSFKLRNVRGWKSCFVLFLGMPLLTLLMVYFGYCWGFWGRESLLLQYLYQCKCPPATEEARYPKSVDVIVPACSYVGSILSPTGNLLYVWEGESGFADTFSAAYLVDFRTNEKIPFFIGKGSHSFLTDDLLFLTLHYGQEGYEGGDYILYRTTGEQYPIQHFLTLREDAYINDEYNLEVLAIELREAQDVYVIHNDIIVALKSDFRISPERRFYMHQSPLPGHYDLHSVEQFLQENGIDYHFVPGFYQEEAVSPDGRFLARNDGIYLAGSGKKIVEAYTVRGINGKYFSVRGWASDSSGVIYYKFDGCLLELPSFDAGTCSISVRQPLVMLKVPEEYLPPNEER